jgi:hypothetical protein
LDARILMREARAAARAVLVTAATPMVVLAGSAS